MVYDSLVEISLVFISDSISGYNKISLDDTEFEQSLYEDDIIIINILKKHFKEVIHYNCLEHFTENIHLHKDHIIFSNWFGKNSRNRKGLVPALCEANNLKYIGPDAYTHLICNDKYLSKIFAREFGLKTSECVLITTYTSDILDAIDHLRFPVVVKPNFEGNSIGISNNSVASDKFEAEILVKNLRNHYVESIIVEEYMPGVEVKVFIFGNNFRIHSIDQHYIEIDGINFFTKEIFGFESKMINHAYKNVKTNIVNKDDIIKMVRIFHSFNKVEYLRIDGRVKDNHFHLIELSPDCDITLNSSIASSFELMGLSYEDGLVALIMNSLYPSEYQIPNKKA